MVVQNLYGLGYVLEEKIIEISNERFYIGVEFEKGFKNGQNLVEKEIMKRK